MATSNDNLPVIIGVGQVTQRPGAERPREPLALMAEAARLAEADTGAGGVLASLESLRVVNVLSWPSKAPAQDLARALAVSPREQQYTAVGGNTPQMLVNDYARRITDGELKLALIAGADAVYSARRARVQGVDLGWSPRGNPPADIGDTRPGMSPQELKHGANLPVRIYPIFENALRRHYKHSIEEHQAAVGALMEKFAAVAASNPYAWFREARSAQQIATPAADNRYIGFPYTKYMNAIMDVDQGAALILASAGEARRLGVPEDRWVHIWGGADATDRWFFSERANFFESPAIKAVGKATLGMAGIAIDDVDYFDIYSCFPSAVQISRDALGIAHDDPRPLTVTGGLPYAGGPGNNFVTHSIAAMVERLRAEPGKIGLVTANGWYVTKHAAGVYSTSPPRNGLTWPDAAVPQRDVDDVDYPTVDEAPSGDATVEAYTLVFNREGAPEMGIVIGKTHAGARFIANTPDDRKTLESMTKQEFVGARGRVSAGGDGPNIFSPN